MLLLPSFAPHACLLDLSRRSPLPLTPVSLTLGRRRSRLLRASVRHDRTAPIAMPLVFVVFLGHCADESNAKATYAIAALWAVAWMVPYEWLGITNPFGWDLLRIVPTVALIFAAGVGARLASRAHHWLRAVHDGAALPLRVQCMP